ncbi:MAG: DUF3734 domain-containing protein [Gammaproteobacteria bacterium]
MTEISLPRDAEVALVLQGGGALGAYQGGAYEAIEGSHYAPEWLVGVSIGAVNAALIAGNRPERRVARLRQFWELVSSGIPFPAPRQQQAREAFNQASAALAATLGVTGFYLPRLPPAMFYPPGTPQAVSLYDAAPLRDTLARLIDFDLLNDGRTRLCVGAVDVLTGNSHYFDNRDKPIQVEHILASCALPPAFAPVAVDGRFYWDSGIVSNTPLQHVLDMRDRQSLLVFQVDLFSAQGPLPQDLGEALQRQKDILYSSRTRYGTAKVAEEQHLRRAMRALVAKLPPELAGGPEAQVLAEARTCERLDIVHLIYRHKPYALASKDYEFSRDSIEEHWRIGGEDMRDTCEHPEWLRRREVDDCVTTYDLFRPAA